MKKTALILGASGQDGSYLSKFLLDKNYCIVCASRDADINNFSNHKALNLSGDIKYATVNINEFTSILKALLKYKPTEIYNLAAQSSVGLSFEKPIETVESIICGTINILEAIRLSNMNIKFYNAGSSEAYGDHGMKRITENSTMNPQSPYAIAKSAAIQLVKMYRSSYNIFACTGILFNHESVLRGKSFVTKKIITTAVKIKKGLESELSLGNIDIYRDWGWAPEYVEAMWLILQQESPEDFIIATGKTFSLKDFVKHTFEYLNLDYKKFLKTNNNLLRPNDIRINKADPSKSLKILGWKAKSDMHSVIQKLLDEEINEYIND